MVLDFMLIIVKLAHSTTNPDTLEIHFKMNDRSIRTGATYHTTSWYRGTGTRSDSATQGDTFTATAIEYDNSSTPYEDEWTFSGVYGATVIGTVNLSSGHDWSGDNDASFLVTLGTTVYTVALTTNCANAAAVVSAINTALTTADDDGSPTNISSKLVASSMKVDATNTYIV